MVKDPVSPALSVSTSTTSMFFGQVKNAVNNRLNNTVSRPNSAANIIAAGRAAKPTATLSNELAASISSYSPPVGRTLARTMHLEVRNNPGSQIDSVADAIQRYLDIRPRNEPTADPLDEDSVARHPQQIIQSAGRWQNEMFYQFSANGLENLQNQAQFRTWSGNLDLKIENPGPAGVYAASSRSQMAGQSVSGRNITYDPAFAAQEAMASIAKAAEPGRANFQYAGPPMYPDDPYFDPNYVSANVMGSLRARLAESSILEGLDTGVDASLDSPVVAAGNAMNSMASTLVTPEMKWLDFGPPDMSEKAILDPVTSGREAVGKFQEAIAPAPELSKVGPANYNEDPYSDPEQAWGEATTATRERLEVAPTPKIKVGRPVYTEDMYTEPVRSGLTVTQVNVGLSTDQMPDRADSYKPRVLDEPFIRALRTIADLNGFTERMGIIGTKA
ncbi:hypothetical protein LJB86_04155 [Deltaproteobacteria bacterium OttesenSCG-928-M10]|nr:hypothetical protein [Deltaproteobacteria bacterium OttesenSCG-928-M10]